MSLTLTTANYTMDIETTDFNLEVSSDKEINQKFCFLLAINQRNGINKKNDLNSR